ncbi:hypothetical protein [Neobacillus mesonae]|uniref:hypothetical protein n=1 Tax=Neobacillus mesonae TaxID=1193713 RepID=UPI0020416D75|nr:hypothetical protein [Neobacillus mesonae]MCM3569169.1 hypothetical protein [Neobacillus mesonae]
MPAGVEKRTIRKKGTFSITRWSGKKGRSGKKERILLPAAEEKRKIRKKGTCSLPAGVEKRVIRKKGTFSITR